MSARRVEVEAMVRFCWCGCAEWVHDELTGCDGCIPCMEFRLKRGRVDSRGTVGEVFLGRFPAKTKNKGQTRAVGTPRGGSRGDLKR